MTETRDSAPSINGESRNLRGYQHEAVAFLTSHRRAILGLPPGTGKTPTALVALRQAQPWRTLIVAPKSVIPHWVALAGEWYPELVVVDGTGPASSRQAARELMDGKPTMPTALILNYEAVRADIEALAGIVWGAIVCDECHRLKTRSALVTKAMIRLSRHPRSWWWGLSGTPAPNRPTELWSQLHIIDRHRWSSYWRWVRQHCDTEISRFRTTRMPIETVIGLKEGAEERIRAELADVLFYRPLEEVLPDLPDATYTTISVDLDAEERKIYDGLAKRAWAELPDGSLMVAANKVAVMTRLRQVVSSMDTWAAGRDKPSSKIAAAAEVIGDLEPEQVVALTWSRASAERLADLTDGEYIHGGVAPAEREKIRARFEAGLVRVLVGTLDTIGEGLDGMQVARHLVRLDRSWTPAKNTQGVARLRRSGQMRTVNVVDITARRTIDAVVERALRDKMDVLDAVLAHRDG